MALHACILAKVKTEFALQAVEYLEKLDSVGLVAPTTGPYDLLILARTESPAALGKTIITEFQAAPGIQETLTLLILKEELTVVNWLAEQARGQSDFPANPPA